MNGLVALVGVARLPLCAQCLAEHASCLPVPRLVCVETKAHAERRTSTQQPRDTCALLPWLGAPDLHLPRAHPLQPGNLRGTTSAALVGSVGIIRSSRVTCGRLRRCSFATGHEAIQPNMRLNSGRVALISRAAADAARRQCVGDSSSVRLALPSGRGAREQVQQGKLECAADAREQGGCI
eukprot:3127956-Prymnesium_polylepis.2